MQQIELKLVRMNVAHQLTALKVCVFNVKPRYIYGLNCLKQLSQKHLRLFWWPALPPAQASSLTNCVSATQATINTCIIPGGLSDGCLYQDGVSPFPKQLETLKASKFKTESTKKLSNFNFQWTKTL